MIPSTPRVCAVTVLHHPDVELLKAQACALAAQTEFRVWVDNAEVDTALHRWAQASGIDYLPQGANRGIGAALNEGIAWACEHGASHVLLLDHDSVPSADLVARLLEAQRPLETASGGLVAAGPRWIGASQEDVPAAADPGPRPVGFLITSGMLVPLAALSRTGPLREDLYIDHVDTEWCWRAREAGITLLRVPSASMRHRLGDSATRLPGLGPRRFAHYAPWRNYMQTRNAIALLRYASFPSNPASARLKLLSRTLVLAMLALLIQGDRRARLRWLKRAVADGWANRLGPPPAQP